MAGSRLTALQERILGALADLKPPWTLTGGGALAALDTQHRDTRDLDLFWRDRRDLGDSAREAAAALQTSGLRVDVLRRSPMFAELRVESSDGVCVVDLVAEPAPALEEPRSVSIGGVTIRADTPHEILVNKLTALLGRAEPRDLWDVKVLVERGVDLDRALADAPRKDGGFSPLTLAWVLRDWQPALLAHASGWPESIVGELAPFRDWLVDRLTTGARPE
ncbi:MAG: nucleotidyl transferase AbiEii/AbiGii toxin family protein [Acidobacteriota bacterium]|nr:nucleotidyl transferase AbiEii/AbiGii toxin family protein [Acidobacteriota bacterium]